MKKTKTYYQKHYNSTQAQWSYQENLADASTVDMAPKTDVKGEEF